MPILRALLVCVSGVVLAVGGCATLWSAPEDPVIAVAVPREADAALRHRAVFEAAIGEPMVAGNDARVLVDGPQTHGTMFAAIDRARRRVHIQSYIVEEEGPGERLAELLLAKRAQGVEVRLLYDAVGSMSTPKEYFERLRAGGVAVCEFNPVNPAKAKRGWQLNNRNHRKILIVDGEAAFTGGVNISSVYSSGSSSGGSSGGPSSGGSSGGTSAGGQAKPGKAGKQDEHWRDTHVIARGPVVRQFEEVFARDWASQKCEDATLKRLAPAAVVKGGWPMRVVVADPETERSQTFAALLNAIAYAHDRVWLTYGYFVPDPVTLRVLREAAARGVDVRLILPGTSDSWVPLHAGRSHYDDLLEAGIRIHERQGALLHAKTAVIDGVWSSVGSTNLDWRSHVHNYEADVVVLSPSFASEMEKLFETDLSASKRITLEAWRDRGVQPRLLEWTARRWAYFL
jgi:cardiolipin synthase